MKKVICVILSVILATACFCINISAEEATTRTEALINQIEETKTISVKLDDSIAENDFVEVSDLNVMFKVQNDGSILSDMKLAATAKVAGLNVRAIFGEENIVYIPGLRCYVSLNEFFDIQTSDVKLLATGVDKLLDYLTGEYFDSLTLTYAGERNIKGYGDVYVERFGTKAEFYYDGDVLLGFKAVSLDTSSFYLTADTKDFLPEYVKGITSGVEGDMFEQPTGFYINITPIVRFIYDLVMSFQ
ncbi:MAG: hypothetical protein IJZ57_05450 [Clostridia bacterium]|nr:hypothetical protein [Clostridia bacterium]